MDKMIGRLTVYFEDPFWVGVFEKIDGNKLSVSKVTFGAEPKDYEVQEFVERHYFKLKYSPPVDAAVKKEVINPKRTLSHCSSETGILWNNLQNAVFLCSFSCYYERYNKDT